MLTEATFRGELPSVSRFYRLRMAISPRDPIARRGFDETVRRINTLSHLFNTIVPDDSKPQRKKYRDLAIFLIGSAGLVAAVLIQISRF
jgi:hypothetical protein